MNEGRSNVELVTDSAAPRSSVDHRSAYLERCRTAVNATRLGVQTFSLSLALWTLYGPHHFALWLLGPRYGMPWVRFAARLHWLLTFVGAQRSTRRALGSMRPYFAGDLSVSQILLRHLELKHECFARARVWSGKRDARSENDLRWRVNPKCQESLPPPERQRGLIVVGFHFNFFQLSGAGIASVLPGIDLVQLRYRSAQCVENAASPVMRLALRKVLEADRRAGASVMYIDETAALVDVYRMLRRGGVVAVAADGMLANDFVEAPFFDGVFRVPSGWAKLAVATNSDILLFCDREIDQHTREGWFIGHGRPENSDDAAFQAVKEAVKLLERIIREEPWGWHPWQRLRVEVGPDGVRRYSLKQYGYKNGKQLDGAPLAQPETVQHRRSDELLGRTTAPTRSMTDDASLAMLRPRVAVLANSYPPYRVHLHQQLAARLPEVELWSLATHSNAYQRWITQHLPEEIRPLDFGSGEPTNQQADQRYALREWIKAGRIIRWLKRNQISAVFSQGCGDMGRMRVMRWCHKHGIPVFLTGDFNIRSDNHRGFKRWLKRQVYTRAVRWSTGLMPCGELGLQLLHRYGGKGKPAAMFPFAPDVQLFEETPPTAIDRMQRQFALEPQRRRIVFSARMMPVKRPDLAVAAFAAIADERPEWDLVMAGDGPLRAELEARVPLSLRERIAWTGFLNNAADVAGLYAQSDVLLLPSDHEPWGVVVVEAAAAGLAIVASDMVGASPELVKDGRNGRVFRAGDVEALRAALLEVTAAERIDDSKRASRDVLYEWLERCDPVENFRSALKQCGLLPEGQQAACRMTARAHSIGLDGVAAVPV